MNLNFYNSFIIICAILLPLSLLVQIEKKLAKDAFMAISRCFIQLSILGLFLERLLATKHIWLVVICSTLFLGLASLHIERKIKNDRYKLFAKQFMVFLIVAPFNAIICQYLFIDKIFIEPSSFLPILGMVLGNSINAIVLARDFLNKNLISQKEEILLNLSFGANFKEATDFLFKESLFKALIPIINSLSIVGLVSLPGLMTGQILAGKDAFIASLEQFVMMVLVFSSIFFSVFFISKVQLNLEEKYFIFNNENK